MSHMIVIKKTELCNRINRAIEDELKGFIEYEELLENIPKELNSEFYDPIVKIMEDEASHAIILRKIGIELGCSEPRMIQKLEDLLKVAESEDLLKVAESYEEKAKEIAMEIKV